MRKTNKPLVGILPVVVCVMDQVYGHLNRPVYLARRNAFFERAVELLFQPSNHLSAPAHVEIVNASIALLKGAKQHGFFATRSSQSLPLEHDFVHFLELMEENIQAVNAMLQHQLHLEQDESFLCQFLGTAVDQSPLPALQYQRRAEDILQGLRRMLQLGQTTYQELKQKNTEALDTTDCDRYQIAYASFCEEAKIRFKSCAHSISQPNGTVQHHS